MGAEAQVKHSEVQREITEEAHQTEAEQEVQARHYTPVGEIKSDVYVTDAKRLGIFSCHTYRSVLFELLLLYFTVSV